PGGDRLLLGQRVLVSAEAARRLVVSGLEPTSETWPTAQAVAPASACCRSQHPGASMLAPTGADAVARAQAQPAVTYTVLVGIASLTGHDGPGADTRNDCSTSPTTPEPATSKPGRIRDPPQRLATGFGDVSQSVLTGAAQSGPLRRAWSSSAHCRLSQPQTYREVSVGVLGSAPRPCTSL